MNIDILDEDGASNIAHPELFGKPNKSELMKHLEKCEKIVQTWPKWKVESVRDAFGIPDSKSDTQIEINRLNKFILDVLDIEGITIEDIKWLAQENGYFCVLVGGDEHHGSYSIRQKYKSHIVTVTKCHCGHIHLLEDMCVECNPDLKDNFLGNGTPIAIIEHDDNDLPF